MIVSKGKLHRKELSPPKCVQPIESGESPGHEGAAGGVRLEQQPTELSALGGDGRPGEVRSIRGRGGDVLGAKRAGIMTRGGGSVKFPSQRFEFGIVVWKSAASLMFSSTS